MFVAQREFEPLTLSVHKIMPSKHYYRLYFNICNINGPFCDFVTHCSLLRFELITHLTLHSTLQPETLNP